MTHKKKRRILPPIDAKRASRLITFLGIVSATIVTVAVWIWYQPGRHTHEHLVTDRTKLRLTLQPALVQDYLSSLAPGVTRFVGYVPKFTSLQAASFHVDWIHALPYEITFLVDQRAEDAFGLTLFVNPIPDNESFVGEVNRFGVLGDLRPIQWEGGARLQPAGDRQFVAKGSLPLSDDTKSTLRAWPKATDNLYDFDGGHHIEFALNNDTGALAAVLDTFRSTLLDWLAPDTATALAGLAPQIARVQAFGDIPRPDDLEFNVKIIGNITLDRATAEATCTAALENLRDTLQEHGGLALQYQMTSPNSLTTEITLHITNYEQRIHQVWR